jgi:hypothetical protein
MAFDLVARLKLKDEFSNRMNRVQRATERMNKAVRATNNSVSNLNSGMSRASGSVSRLTGTFVGLAAAVGGAVAAQKAFNATIGEAAKYERSRGLLTAMMGDGKKAKKLIEEIDKMAINSPLLNSQDMMAAASAFLPMTKDINRLKKLYDLSERLFVLNDKEGMEGASFALREFLMGQDATSLAERFNLSRKELSKLKTLSFDKQLAQLDEMLNKMGITRKTINTIGEDTLAKWSQIKERMSKTFRMIGEPSLKVLNNFLTNLINRFDSGDLTRFANVGANIVKNILTGMTNNAMKIYDWFTALSNSEEFRRKTTLTGKIAFIFDDLYKKFTQWLDASGQKQINAAASKIIDVLATAVEGAAPRIAAVAMTVGKAIGEALVKGAASYIKKNFASAIINSTPAGIGKSLFEKAGAYIHKHTNKSKKAPSYFIPPRGTDIKYSHAGGISYVPYNGYNAILHRGERVLTREENREYSKGKTPTVNITISNMSVRNDSDIKRIAHELAKLLEREGAAMAW